MTPRRVYRASVRPHPADGSTVGKMRGKRHAECSQYSQYYSDPHAGLGPSLHPHLPRQPRPQQNHPQRPLGRVREEFAGA